MPNCNISGKNNTCLDDEDRCLVMRTSTIDRDKTEHEFRRACANKDACARTYCENTMIKILKKATCQIKCCTEKLCNTGDVSAVVGDDVSAVVRDSLLYYTTVLLRTVVEL